MVISASPAAFGVALIGDVYLSGRCALQCLPHLAYSMLAEVAKPFAFTLCILSLYGMFYTAFLNPANNTDGRILDLLALAALAAAISFTSGLIFLEADEGPEGGSRLISTLPVRLFFWASSTIFVLFLVSWYLESHCVFYRDVRFYAGMP